LRSDPAKTLLLKINYFKKYQFYLLKLTFQGQKQHFKITWVINWVRVALWVLFELYYGARSGTLVYDQSWPESLLFFS